MLPHNLAAYTGILTDKGATHIFILTDLDDRKCVTLTRGRIDPAPGHTAIVGVKTIESWFLADTAVMARLLDDNNFYCPQPQLIDNPFEEIKTLRMVKTGRGVTDKKVLANTLVRKYGFSIVNAAAHPGCSSAAYFLKKIEWIARG